MSNDANSGVRSPSYPVFSLSDAITVVRKIEAQYRSAKVDREVAAKIIGYSGLSGPANKALAALAQYGLVERAGKGEMRVSARARAILHPDDVNEKRRELQAAAFEPRLFQDLQERYPNMTPPEDGVVSYLNRLGFNQTAIRPAVKAYLQTLLFLEEQGASESHGGESAHAPQTVPDDEEWDGTMEPNPPIEHALAKLPAGAIPIGCAKVAPDLNIINMNIRGDKVYLDGLLDYDGLIDLEKKIAALKILLAAQPKDGGSEKPN